MNRIRRRRPLASRGGALRVLGVALAGAALLASAPAAAGNVTVTQPMVKRTKPDGGTTVLQRPDSTSYYISYADCIDPGFELDFPVQITGSAANFHVWAALSGTDCTTTANRTAAGANCHELAPTLPTVTVKAADLVNGLLGLTSCIDNKSTSNAPISLNIYFVLVPSTGDPAAADIYTWGAGTTKTAIALLGPPAPTGVSLGIGDSELILNLPANTDSNTQGYVVYCAPASALNFTSTTSSSSSSSGSSSSSSSSSASSSSGSSSSTSSSSSASSSSGTGGASGTSSSSSGSSSSGTAALTACPSGAALPNLDPKHPDINSPFVCGMPSTPLSASATAPLIQSLANGQNLANGTEYVVAIAAFDQSDNIGPLSVLQCGTPQKTDSFYDQYCKDGGSACTGGCGIRTVGSGTDPLWPSLGAAAAAIAGLALRRARSSKRASSKGASSKGAPPPGPGRTSRPQGASESR